MDVRFADGNIIITGNIKTNEDYLAIKTKIQERILLGDGAIAIVIADSTTISSSIIGFFLKVANKDKIPVTLKIASEKLRYILGELGLADLLNVSE